MRPELPSGTVTFLFTDVEGSTRLLHELGAEEYAEALAEHRRVIREACREEGGMEVDTQGDAFFFAFPTAAGALAAASAVTDSLASGPIQVRVGLHTGTPLLTEEGYVGDDVHFAARVAGSGHGGQVILSRATAELVELSLTDLGEHRLKDIEQAVSIFQLGDGSFPPLKTISNTNLPRPASSFVGREAELVEVLSRIEQGARLVTLTGPGGTGKTRLALEAATTLVPEYKAGVFWIGLASLRDPALVTETISLVLGAKDGLAEHIAGRELLLLLDNLEQVIDSAPELSTLLQHCSNLTLLVTSRELLRVQGEVEYPVPPLAKPEAVDLFCVRSQVEPSEEIAELCTRLDLLPLAVELAAARTKAFSPAQILERLSQQLDLLKGGRDVDPRQQTLRATIEWSYALLTEEEQRLFRTLSVFAGGSILKAAEEVCVASIDTLQSLVEKSLVRFSGDRYWMLETIREYAGERLQESGESGALREYHTTFFLDFACREGRRFETESEPEAVERLLREEANLRLAAEHLASQDSERLLLMVSSLRNYWTVAGRLPETREWASRALASSSAEDSERRAATLFFLSGAATRAGDVSDGIALAQEAVEMYARLGADGVSHALEYLGNAHSHAGNRPEAVAAYERAIAEAVRVDNQHRRASATGNLGYLLLLMGEYDRAEELLSEAFALEHALGRDIGAWTSMCNAGLAAVQGQRLEAAGELLAGVLRPSWQMGHVGLVASCLEGFAAIAVASGEYERAGTLHGASAARLAETGAVLDPVERSIHDEARAAIEAAVGTDYERHLASGLLLTAEEAVEYALSSID